MTRRLLLLVTLLMALAPLRATAQDILPAEASGISRFWQAQQLLSRDVEPPDSLWNAMWDTPGYRMLHEVERRRPALTTAMRLAFMPSRRTAADSAVRAGGWVARVIPHLRTVVARRDTLVHLAASLASPEAMMRARSLALEYLPAGEEGRHPAPGVSLLYFIDARGFERILLDPAYLMDLHDPIPVLGHELHHYYRNRLARAHRPFGEDMLAWRLSTTETEGIAGLVDKREVPSLPRDSLPGRYRSAAGLAYFQDYQEHYKRSNQWLAWVDHALSRVDAHPDSALAIGREIDRSLPDNGRIMGAFMATVIERQLGKPELIATVGDPWRFWRSYNVAARRSNGEALVLSARAMRVIDAVEARYAEAARR